ncbi:GTPase Era [SAR202 cluster bacterium AD-802-E10_MRT_200m]|nr:GTPase Era [SAR202 cluster bacterium AD-802-E10_MRT_200m]
MKVTKVRKSGNVAIVGRSNTGKSTLLNAILGQKLVIVSHKPQTTRQNILGILTDADYQTVLLDTPGLMHRTRDTLDQRMNRSVIDAINSADLVLLVIEPFLPSRLEIQLINHLKENSVPSILVINKIDLIRKEKLLPVIAAYADIYTFADIIPVGALQKEGISLLMARIKAHLPVGDHEYDQDQITDRPERFFAAEFIREQLFLVYGQEVPYDTAVVIEEFQEQNPVQGGKDVIVAMIYVSKPSQRRILIGSGGKLLKKVGIAARIEIERMTGRPAYLDLTVTVREKWRQRDDFLEAAGY